MNTDFFELSPSLPVHASSPRQGDQAEALGQYFTPAWAAELLYDAAFPSLGDGDTVWEPGAGGGACLAAVPAHIRAFGTEIDPKLAKEAARLSGRIVIEGDLRTCEFPAGMTPTAVFGNPDFKLDLVDDLLERLVPVLGEGQRCALLLPSYAFQTSGRVLRYNRHFTLSQEAIPRDLFPGLSKPLAFVMFDRAAKPILIGFRLYAETRQIRDMPQGVQDRLAAGHKGSRSVWVNLLAGILREQGGRSNLSQIYRSVEGRQPTGTEWWREQIRKVLRQHTDLFASRGDGEYELRLA